MRYCFPSLLSAFSVWFAQPTATDAVVLHQSLQFVDAQRSASLVQHIPFENIGPKVMSGRWLPWQSTPGPDRVLRGLCLWRGVTCHR